MTWANKKPWDEIGVEVNASLSAREMLGKANIDRQISKNKRLKSVANEKAFRFFKSFANAGDAGIETIGTLEEGRIVWALARLEEDFFLEEVDKVKGYLLLASLQENRESIQIKFMTMRVDSNSILQIAVKTRTSFRNIYLTSTSFDSDMNNKVIKTFALGRTAISEFASEAKRLANKKVDEQTAKRYMFDVFQPEISRELPSIGQDEIEKHAEEKTRKAIEAIEKAPGQDMETAHNTAWGLLNAVTYTIDHQLCKNQDFRLRQAWFGTHAKTKQRALDLAIGLL